MAPTRGAQLGIYEVTAKIGQGGIGEIHRARDAKLNRKWALKVLRRFLRMPATAWAGSSARARMAWR